MQELLRTNDVVLLSLVELILTQARIAYFVADQFMSALEGSTPFMARRVMVAGDDKFRARRALADAGLEDELPPR